MTTPMIASNRMRRLREAFAVGRTLSVHDAAKVTHLHVRRAREYLKLLKGQGEIHVIAWDRKNRTGPWHPIYVIGGGEDAPCPELAAAAPQASKEKA